MNKNAKALLNLFPKQLRSMDKQEVHEGYAILMARMLMEFYVDVSNAESSIETMRDLQGFIAKWVAKHLKRPHSEWQPGDCGK